MFNGDFITAVNALAAVKAAKAKAFWGQCPDPANLPYIVALRVGGARVTCHGGGTQMDEPRLQIDCVASTLGTALTLRAAIIDAFNGVRQDIGGTRIYSAIHQGDLDAYDGGPNFYVASTDILFQTYPIA
jgi:hypothetical protein